MHSHYHGLKNNIRFYSAIRRRKRAFDDVTANQILAVLRCVWLLAGMPSSRAAFGLNNHKSGLNSHLQNLGYWIGIKKPWNVPYVGAYFKSEMCRVCAMVKRILDTHTPHISEFFFLNGSHGQYNYNRSKFWNAKHLEHRLMPGPH